MDRNKVLEIAKLARLELPDSQIDLFTEQITKSLQYFDQISKVNTAGVESLITPTEMDHHWHKDEAKKEYTTEELLENAPEKVGNLFKVPPVV